MNSVFVWFWTIMIFSSFAWYAFLLFYLGFKGGREIIAMIRALSRQQAGAPSLDNSQRPE